MADDWQTPPDLVKVLRQEFNFTHEVCAAADNRCMPDLPYLGLDNGLDAMHNEWGEPGEVIFCNPPYSQLPAFADRAYGQAVMGNRQVVLLVPAYSDTLYWWDYFATAPEIRLIKGRIRFWENGKPGKNGARFPSALINIHRAATTFKYFAPQIRMWDWKAAAK